MARFFCRGAHPTHRRRSTVKRLRSRLGDLGVLVTVYSISGWLKPPVNSIWDRHQNVNMGFLGCWEAAVVHRIARLDPDCFSNDLPQRRLEPNGLYQGGAEHMLPTLQLCFSRPRPGHRIRGSRAFFSSIASHCETMLSCWMAPGSLSPIKEAP